jgi:hypothetical protein
MDFKPLRLPASVK